MTLKGKSLGLWRNLIGPIYTDEFKPTNAPQRTMTKLHIEESHITSSRRPNPILLPTLIARVVGSLMDHVQF